MSADALFTVANLAGGPGLGPAGGCAPLAMDGETDWSLRRRLAIEDAEGSRVG